VTCIVGISHNNTVYIGGDRGASDGSSILPLRRPKIVKINNYLVGYAGSQGIGQLAHMIELPSIPNNKNITKTLRTTFIRSLKNAVEEFGNASVNEDNSTDWLVGIHGRLFEITSEDWQVSEFEETSIGSGNYIALGSLHTSRSWKDQEKRIRYALQAAVDISPSCLGPIDILHIDS
jgi:ATP-dependent protease HslVU (ClpYQ) peptidase subunit